MDAECGLVREGGKQSVSEPDGVYEHGNEDNIVEETNLCVPIDAVGLVVALEVA